MIRTTVLERGRIERDPEGRVASGTPARRKIPAVLYDRLLRVEGRHEDRDGDPIFTWGRNRATVGPWVGVLQIPGLQLEILPKTDDAEITESNTDKVRDNLVQMLSYGGLSAVRSRGSTRLARREGTLHDQLVARFLERLLEELVRGMDRTYSTVDENLGTVRGKLLVAAQVSRNAGKRHRFWCRFDALDDDTRINSTLRRACDTLSRRSLPVSVQRRLSEVLLLLADVSPNPPSTEGEVVFTRQNSRFEDVYTFACMVLDGDAPEVKAGSTATYSLLFNMDKVFEGYIAAFVERHVLVNFGGAVTLDAQASKHRKYLFQRRYPPERGGTLNLAPDLHLTWKRPDGQVKTLIADTKWKRLEPGRPALPGRSDLYQLYAYVHRYPCDRAVLLYPHVDGVREADFDAAGDGTAPGSAAAKSVGVRLLELKQDLSDRSGRDRLAAQLDAVIREGFGMPAGVHSVLAIPTPSPTGVLDVPL